MQWYRRFLWVGLLSLIMLGLWGCVYHPDVQQGNVITDNDIKSLHRGMTADEVRSLLGDPVLENMYQDNRLIYVYTYQHRREKMQVTRLFVFLRNNQVSNFWVDKG